VAELLTRLVVFTALAIVTGLIALTVKYVSSRADTRAMPQADEKIRLLRELQLLRQQHKNHAECLQYLRTQGLRKGVATRLMIEAETTRK
jgi:hypothetical protein